jgi:hypothetical protein
LIANAVFWSHLVVRFKQDLNVQQTVLCFSHT